MINLCKINVEANNIMNNKIINKNIVIGVFGEKHVSISSDRLREYCLYTVG